MSFFQRTTQTVKIDDENSVELRKLNYGERQRCMSKAMTVKAHGGENEVTIDAALLQLEMLKFAVTSWTGPGFDGRPVTPSNIEELPGDIADKLASAVDGLNPEVSEDEKKD